MSSEKKLDELDRKISNVGEEFNKIKDNPIIASQEQKIKVSKPLFYYYNIFLIAILVFLIYIYGYGIISNTISSIFRLIVESQTLNNQFGIGTIYLGYFAVLNILILPIYFIVENKAHFREQHFKISLVILMLILIPSYFLTINAGEGIVLDNPGEELTQRANQTFFQSIRDILTATKCSIPTNANLPECVALLQTQTAQVDQLQTITIRGNNLDSNTYTLQSKEDYIRFQYYIDTPIDIQLTKIECLSSKDNFREPFFEKKIDDVIRGSRNYGFECENVGELLDREEQRISFRTILYYNTTTTHSIQVPAINCQYPQLASFLEKENLNCRDTPIDLIEKNVERIPRFNTVDLSSNIIRMGVDSFKNQLPLRLQDGIETRADLGITLTPTTNAGILQAGEIKNIIIPEVLIEEQVDETTRVEQLQAGQTLFLRKRLFENEQIQINQNQLIISQPITFDIYAELTVRKNHNSVLLKALFDIISENEENNNNNNNIEPQQEETIAEQTQSNNQQIEQEEETSSETIIQQQENINKETSEIPLSP